MTALLFNTEEYNSNIYLYSKMNIAVQFGLTKIYGPNFRRVYTNYQQEYITKMTLHYYIIFTNFNQLCDFIHHTSHSILRKRNLSATNLNLWMLKKFYASLSFFCIIRSSPWSHIFNVTIVLAIQTCQPSKYQYLYSNKPSFVMSFKRIWIKVRNEYSIIKVPMTTLAIRD